MRDGDSAMLRVDVSRFFVASDRYSSEATRTESAWHYADGDGTGPSDDDLTVHLDAVRIALAVMDLFVVLHRCACLGCCSCCCHGDGRLVVGSGGEVVRNGVTDSSGIVLCSRHDRQQRKHKIIGRSPNGSVTRPSASFDVCDNDEDFDDVPGGLCPLCRRRRRGGEDASVKAPLRRGVGRARSRSRWTPEQRRRRRQLAALLTRLVLCTTVVSLVYIVVRTLDALLVELMTVMVKQRSGEDLLLNEAFLGETLAEQVGGVKIYPDIDLLIRDRGKKLIFGWLANKRISVVVVC